MGLLLLLACGHVLEPHEQGNIVFEVFGGYAAVGTEKTADMHVHGVDVLQMFAVPDLGLVAVIVVGGVGGEEHMLIAVGCQVFGGDLVLVSQDYGAFFLDVLAQGSIQLGSIHEADTGHYGVKALVAILDHAKYASLVLRGFGRVITAALIGLAGHIVVGAILIQASLVEAFTAHVIALVADGKQHLVELDLTGHRGGFLVQTEGVEDLMAPGEGGLNAEIALLSTLLDRSTRNGEFNEFLPNGGGLVCALKGGIGRSHEEMLAALTEVALITTLEALLDHEALAGFRLAVRAVGLLVLEGVIFDQAIAAVSLCAAGNLHHIHDLTHKLLLLAGRELLQHGHQLIQVISSCHHFNTS